MNDSIKARPVLLLGTLTEGREGVPDVWGSLPLTERRMDELTRCAQGPNPMDWRLQADHALAIGFYPRDALTWAHAPPQDPQTGAYTYRIIDGDLLGDVHKARGRRRVLSWSPEDGQGTLYWNAFLDGAKEAWVSTTPLDASNVWEIRAALVRGEEAALAMAMLERAPKVLERWLRGRIEVPGLDGRLPAPSLDAESRAAVLAADRRSLREAALVALANG